MAGNDRDIWQSSEHFNELGKEDKIRYKETLTFSDGTTITDPYGLSNNWKNNVAIAIYIMGRHIQLPC